MSVSACPFALVSYAQLSTATTTCVSPERVSGGGAENPKPATQICHRLRNRAHNSRRGAASRGLRVRRRTLGPRAGAPPRPPSALLPLLLLSPPRPSTEARPGPARALASGPRVRPRPLSPSAGRLTLALPARAGAEGAGPPRLGPGSRRSPTGSSHSGRALALPPSLSRSLRPGYLGGLRDGIAREGSLCAAPRE